MADKYRTDVHPNTRVKQVTTAANIFAAVGSGRVLGLFITSYVASASLTLTDGIEDAGSPGNIKSSAPTPVPLLVHTQPGTAIVPHPFTRLNIPFTNGLVITNSDASQEVTVVYALD